MRRSILLTTILLLGATTAEAGSFEPASLIPEQGIEALDRATARQQLQRDLFGDPWASVVVGRVDVYESFPYLEARYFQVVSDPGWDRLLFGEADKGLSAFDGSESSFGALKAPRGLATDEYGRLYVADSGNDRILVFETSSEFDELTITPLYAVEDLKRPHDVAFSDGGTPFDPSDDRLYVAETGRNRVARVSLDADGGRVTATLGALGSGEGRFAGPTAIAVGRDDGRSTGDVYVADSHSSRIVHLVDDGALEWDGALQHELGMISDLDTDHWGNVYAASPQAGAVEKFAKDLLPVAELRDGVNRPRSFHVPMLTVHDHVRGTVTRQGHGGGVMVEQWSDTSGLRVMDLGVELRDVAIAGDESTEAQFTLSDRARITASIVDPSSGRALAQRDLGWMDAGRNDADLATLLAGVDAGDYRLDLRATSSYDRDRVANASSSFAFSGGENVASRVPQVLGANPNPFNPRTTIEFVVPQGPALSWQLQVVDLRGRVIRSLGSGEAVTGRHGIDWDGTDDRGGVVGSGVYLYRLKLGDDVHSGKLALVK